MNGVRRNLKAAGRTGRKWIQLFEEFFAIQDGAVLVDVDGVAGERIVPNLSIAERKSVWSARSSVRSNFVL